ncbi:MAG: chromate efflux transporter [Chloroflexota bacterium]
MDRAHRLRELVAVFGMLGLIGFGGPLAHIGLMRREVVDRRRWLTESELLDLIGLTSLIPGPNSTELAMLVGHKRAGGWGLMAAGLAFILPAAALVLTLAWAYVTYGTTPAAEALLYGVKPVVLAVVAAALVGFGRTALNTRLAAAIGLGAAGLWAVGVNELAVLAGAALVMAAVRVAAMRGPLAAVAPLAAMAGRMATAAQVDLWLLTGVFLKAGALLFGSGYVLLAYLRGDLVVRLGWLTDQQLLDAVAVGQVTPGPLFTTATFIGYVVAGLAGAVLATIAIFLPAFVLSALIGRVAHRVREWATTGALLDGLNAGSIGLMAAVTVQLATHAVVDPATVALAALALIGLVVKVPSIVLVAAGGAAGLALRAAGIGP